MRDHLLGSKGDAGSPLGRKRQDFVHRIGVQTLRASKNAGERLDRRPDDVDLWLLGGERYPGGLGMETQLGRARGPGRVAIAHPTRPDPARRTVLGDLLEEIDVSVEEEAQPGANSSTFWPAAIAAST